MKMSIFRSSFIAVTVFGIVGCGGGSSDKANRIVGTWTKSCHKPSEDENARYRTQKIVFDANKSFTYEKIKYSDDKCTQDPDKTEGSGTYKIGKETKADDNKTAYEIDFKLHTGYKIYSMYRFLKNGNLVIADGTDTNTGESSELRANHFDPNWEGYSKK